MIGVSNRYTSRCKHFIEVYQTEVCCYTLGLRFATNLYKIIFRFCASTLMQRGYDLEIYMILKH